MDREWAASMTVMGPHVLTASQEMFSCMGKPSAVLLRCLQSMINIR